MNYSVQLPLGVLAQGGFHACAHTRGESLQTRTYVFKDVNAGSRGTAQAFGSIQSIGPIVSSDLVGTVSLELKRTCK